MSLLAADARRAVIRACGAGDAVLDVLLDYGASPYQPEAAVMGAGPIEDELHVPVWEGYAAQAATVGVFPALRERFPQLRFPIADGMSREPAYRAATLRGEFGEAEAFAPGVLPRRPELVTLSIVPSAAGRVPVVVAGDRGDFETLVRAFTERNEPADVPASMGACLVNGLINWHRIALHREQWARGVADASDEAWGAEFRALVPQKARYQDRLILLSAGPYSAVPGEESGGPAETWRDRSVVIRREHELFHYFTYRRFGRIRTHVFDELLADFAGLVGADRHYRAALALRFLGLDGLPAIRPEGRVLNYVREKLPAEAWPVVGALAARAARNLETIAARHAPRLGTPAGMLEVLLTLCPLSLDELASDAAPGHVDTRLAA